MTSFSATGDDPADRDDWSLDELTGPVAGLPEDGDDIVAVLDSEAMIQRRDPRRLLWALATAGAQVRHAVATRDRWNAAALADDQLPRAVLVVTDPSASVGGAVLAELGCERTPVIDWRGPELPRWAGAADVLLASSVDGRHPRVATLLADADRRGLTIVAVSPPDTPVAAAAGRGIRIEVEAPNNRRAALWALLTPLLVALDAMGVITATGEVLHEVADDLDSVAQMARPGTDAFTNGAKQLAIEFADTEPVLAGCGPLSRLAAGWWADSLAVMAGVGAVALGLPDDFATARALLEIPPAGTVRAGSGGADDFFRDRAEDVSRRRRLVVLAENEASGPARGQSFSAEAGPDLHDLAAGRAAGVLYDIASARGLASSALDVPGRGSLARFAAATLFGDFVAAYVAIGRGLDPDAIQAGNLPH